MWRQGHRLRCRMAGQFDKEKANYCVNTTPLAALQLPLGLIQHLCHSRSKLRTCFKDRLFN